MHIHIENNTAEAAVLHVSPDQLRQRLAAIPNLGDTVSVSVATAAAFEPVAAHAADIMFVSRKLNLTDAKAVNPGLAWAQITSAGVEAWLKDLPDGMILTNASGVHGKKGAEFILAACLMLNFDIPRFVDDKAGRVWRPTYGSPIAGRTVAVLGVGAIGRDAVAALRAIGVRVVGVTRSGRCDVAIDECVAIEELDTVLPRVDILVSILPLTPQTRAVIDRRRFGLLPHGAGVVNVGRGGVMDHEALVEMLTTGRLGGAVLDVFPNEPPAQDDPLWTCPRLIMTPHCGLDDHAAYLDACLDIFCANVARFAAGEPLVNVVDPTRGY